MFGLLHINISFIGTEILIYRMNNSFFKDFSFLSGFFHLSEGEQVNIEQQLKLYISYEEQQLATFLGDTEYISLLLLWLGKEYYKRIHKKWSLRHTLAELNIRYQQKDNLGIVTHTNYGIQESIIDHNNLTNTCLNYIGTNQLNNQNKQHVLTLVTPEHNRQLYKWQTCPYRSSKVMM